LFRGEVTITTSSSGMDVPDATHPGKARNLPNHQVGV